MKAIEFQKAIISAELKANSATSAIIEHLSAEKNLMITDATGKLSATESAKSFAFAFLDELRTAPKYNKLFKDFQNSQLLTFAKNPDRATGKIDFEIIELLPVNRLQSAIYLRVKRDLESQEQARINSLSPNELDFENAEKRKQADEKQLVAENAKLASLDPHKVFAFLHGLHSDKGDWKACVADLESLFVKYSK